MAQAHSSYGKFTSDGEVKRVHVGFRPSYIKIRVDGAGYGFWMKGMRQGKMDKITGSGYVLSHQGIRVDDVGFTLSKDPDLNASGKEVVWRAER